MIGYALAFGFASFSLALLLNLYRLAKGPTMADRVLALDTMVINVIALVILFGIKQGTGIYFETSMLLAMVGFVSSVALCKFILRGDVIE